MGSGWSFGALFRFTAEVGDLRLYRLNGAYLALQESLFIGLP